MVKVKFNDRQGSQIKVFWPTNITAASFFLLVITWTISSVVYNSILIVKPELMTQTEIQPLSKSVTANRENENIQKPVDVANSESKQGNIFTSRPVYTGIAAIAVVAMGEAATETTLVERCLRSARVGGNWNGAFIVLTDAPVDTFQYLHKTHGENVIVLQAKPKDMNEDLVKVMTYKRFKTLIWEYVELVPELENLKWIAYVDIDIVFGRDLNLFFQDFLETTYHTVSDKEHINNELENTVHSKLYFFPEQNPLKKRQGQMHHGGIIIMHRTESRDCLKLWQAEFDKTAGTKARRDQNGLKAIRERIQDGLETNCKLVSIQKQIPHVVFPESDLMQKMVEHHAKATFIHVTNTNRAKRIPGEIQEEFFRYVLQIPITDTDSALDHLVKKQTHRR